MLQPTILKILNQFSILSHIDDRVFDKPFTSIGTYFLLTIGYLYIVKNGSKFMQNRKPFELNRLIMIYNLVQVALNSALVLDVSN